MDPQGIKNYRESTGKKLQPSTMDGQAVIEMSMPSFPDMALL